MNAIALSYNTIVYYLIKVLNVFFEVKNIVYHAIKLARVFISNIKVQESNSLNDIYYI